jgi:hypothetical protein
LDARAALRGARGSDRGGVGRAGGSKGLEQEQLVFPRHVGHSERAYNKHGGDDERELGEHGCLRESLNYKRDVFE